MKAAIIESINLCGRTVDYRLINSKSAQKLRVRVGLSGVEVVQPMARDTGDVEEFLIANGEWIIGQLERIERFRPVRKPQKRSEKEILFRGNPTSVYIEEIMRRQRTNQVIYEDDCLKIIKGLNSRTSPAKSLENWLRKQAREEIERHVNVVARKLKRFPKKIYIMGQRTKWGNCSARHNLSFNWRIILAPDFVRRYLITHEVVHLAIPDHSQRFWLTVQSHCSETEKARQWLSANSHQLLVDLNQICLG